MDGFTPTFLLQLVLVIGSSGAVYGAIRADLNNMKRSLDEERRLREKHETEDDRTHHDIRDEIASVVMKVSVMEGRALK